MQTTVSTKGQVVLPSPLRRKLGIQPGDPLDVNVESGRIVLTPRRKRTPKARIIKNPITGMSVISFGSNVPKLTSEDVAAILTDFP